jgi:uncharacterized protein (DUF433 family)
MSKAIATVPLTTGEAGVLLITGTRVPLDSVIHAFNEGATPEEIAQNFPTLDLADVYAVVSYYLQNRSEVEQYLEQRKVQQEELKRELQAQFPPHGIRERLLARRR